jgi:transcriptional regulator with XRE-family HTH domain
MKSMSISTTLRNLREAKGYSQDYMSIQLDITQQAYSNIEKKPEKCSLERLREIARVLQVPLVTLIGLDDQYIQQNFHQAGGNAATQMNISPPSSESEAFKLLIAELKQEVTFLRGLVSKK